MNGIQQKIITAEIKLADSPGTSTVPNRYLTLEGHRISCEINIYGGESKGKAHIKIYGLSLTDMTNMTNIGASIIARRTGNLIRISAGTDKNNLTVIYTGNIDTAYADFNSSPDVPLVIEALDGVGLAFDSYPPTSPEKSSVSISGMFKNYADDAKLKFIDGLVTGTLDYPSYSGSLFSQVMNLARDANCNVIIDNGFLKISPILGSFSKSGDTIVKITPSKGMIGYPILSANMVKIKTLFNPDIKYGHTVEVAESVVKPANGRWVIYELSHVIESYVQNGQWFTNIGVHAA